MPKETITIEVDVKNPIEKSEVTSALKAFAALNFDERNRISQIVQSPKALKAIKENWTFLKLKFA